MSPRRSLPPAGLVALACASLLCAGMLLSACASVAPWERGTLAQPAMRDELDPEEARFDGHLRGAREIALDPASSGGGGCGCN